MPHDARFEVRFAKKTSKNYKIIKFFSKNYCKQEKNVVYYATVEYSSVGVGFNEPALNF